jgi:hypothetical protein
MMRLARAIRGLLYGGRDTLSMGRVAFWPLYLISLKSWILGGDPSERLFTFLLIIAGYCFGSKGWNALREVKSFRGDKPCPPQS